MTREVVQIIDKETGDVNNLRDKKLADSTTQQQSGSASTDSVVMKTTGGDYVEIARDSFVGAIKSVMDGLIKGNSYTTLGADDPIAAFNSNALGGITPANLASVLGGHLRVFNYNFNGGGSHNLEGIIMGIGTASNNYVRSAIILCTWGRTAYDICTKVVVCHLKPADGGGYSFSSTDLYYYQDGAISGDISFSGANGGYLTATTVGYAGWCKLTVLVTI